MIFANKMLTVFTLDLNVNIVNIFFMKYLWHGTTMSSTSNQPTNTRLRHRTAAMVFDQSP